MKHRKITKPGLKWRIVGLMSLFCLMILVILWLFQVVFLEDIYRAIKRTEIYQSAVTITKNIDTEDDDIETLATRISQENDVCISIYTSGFESIASSCIGKDCILHHMPEDVLDKYYRDAIKNGGRDLESIPRDVFRFNRYDPNKYEGDVPGSDSGMGESLLLTVVEESEARGEVAVFLNLTTSPVGSTKKTLQTELVFIVIILLASSVVISFILSRYISSRIIKPSRKGWFY